MADNKLIVVSPKLLDETLKRLKDKTVVVEFETSWCSACKAIKRPLRKLATKGQGSFYFVQVDVTREYELLNQHTMKLVFPGFLVVSPGLKEPVRMYGGDKLELLEPWLLAGDKRPTVSPMIFGSGNQDLPAKAVLIAGSSEVANFAQEVAFVRGLLVEKGINAEQTACFFANPDPISYFADQKQFDELKDFLSDCRVATREEILRTIQKGLLANPKTFVLYASSHGQPPIKAPKLEKDEPDCLARAPALVLDSGDHECDKVNHLTPEAIASVVPADNNTQKVFIFQGCYTGGFISNTDNPASDPSALAKLPHTTILTASRSDRASFGCQAGTLTTIYGGAFTSVLLEDKQPLASIPWLDLHKRIVDIVNLTEKKIRLRPSSEPQFFQTP
ncbi:MAG: thioredoxin domain-containing protein [Bdellovibrionota bacterium]